MKRYLALLICFALCAAIVGCAAQEGGVAFYYLRSEPAYGTEDALIAPEIREEADAQSLEYLLRLYLDGPLTDTLTSPFPRGTRLIALGMEENTLSIVLSEEFGALEGVDLTLAAGCLARTCFALTDAEQIEMATEPGEVRLTLNRDSLVLLDDSASEAAEEQED